MGHIDAHRTCTPGNSSLTAKLVQEFLFPGKRFERREEVRDGELCCYIYELLDPRWSLSAS